MAKKLVNAVTEKDVHAFIENVKNGQRKKDAKALLEIMNEVTGKQPKIWGTSIIGYGKYSYQRKNGDEFEWFNVGFSPGSKHMSVYFMYDLEKEKETLKKLGPHSNGKGCLYIKKLDDVDLDVLKEMIAKSDQWKRD